jgi:hypothetical protein
MKERKSQTEDVGVEVQPWLAFFNPEEGMSIDERQLLNVRGTKTYPI